MISIIFDSETETIFIEIDKSIFNTCSNIVTEVIYRMPNSSVDTINERIADIFNVIQKEHQHCYLLGDLYIDFWNLMSIEPRANYLMYYIAAMYFSWSRSLRE